MSEPHKLRLDDQLCFALYAATNAVTRAYRPRLGELGLTYPQYLVMLVLWQDGPGTVGQIAGRLGLGQNALTPLLDRLTASGLVSRTRDTKDRRVLRIALTAEGIALEQATSLAQQSVECDTGLAPEDLNELRETLFALVRRMDGEEAEKA